MSRSMPRLAASVLLLALALAGAGGCSNRVRPPGDPGVCYHVTFKKSGEIAAFNKLVNAPNLEVCAANLEAMRLKFLGLGGSAQSIAGAYQANFIFVEPKGISTSTTLDGPRYIALVRTGDGRLAIPGAMPQPTQ